MHIQKSLTEQIELNVVDNKSETIANKFGENFQTHLFKAFILDNKFWSKIYTKLSKDLFSRFHGYIFEEFEKYYQKYNSLPSKDILLSSINNSILSDDNKVFIKETISDIFHFSEKTNQLDYYKDAIRDFIRDRNVKDAFIKSVNLFKKGEYSRIAELMNDAVKEVDIDKTIGIEFLNSGEIIDQKIDLDLIETPFDGINIALKGGLAKKELGLIMGGTSSGKSWTLQTIGAHALMSGRNVVYYTLEMSDVQVIRRFASITLGKDTDDITSKDIQKIKDAIKQKGISGRLFIVEYPTKGCSIYELKENLNGLYNHHNFKPDLILVDYGDLMNPRKHYSEKRHEISSIYEDLRGLGGEFNAGVWTISQVNRSGYGKKLITVESIAEDFNKTTICDFILSIGRDINDRVGGHAQAFIAKNRRGKDALKFSMDMDFSIGKISMDADPDEVMDAQEYKEKRPDINDDAVLQDLIRDLDV